MVPALVNEKYSGGNWMFLHSFSSALGRKHDSGLHAFFSSHFFCWWPWMLLLPLSCFNQCAFLREGSSHSALYLNMILVKAGLYFICWAYGSICWIIEFIGYFLNLENNLVIWPANKSKFLKEELLWTYCFQIAEVTLK